MSDSESIREILKTAQEIVDGMHLEPDLRPVAYSKAIDLIAIGVASLEQRPATKEAGTAISKTPAHGTESSHRLASAFGIDVELIELVYVASGDQLDLVLNRSKLPKERFRAMRTLTVLFAAGRQALGMDEGWTRVDLIREVCRDFGVLDSGNFAAAVSAVGDAFVMKGRGAQRELKVTRAGFEEAGRLILQLVGSVR
jgi:hypothetical protein